MHLAARLSSKGFRQKFGNRIVEFPMTGVSNPISSADRQLSPRVRQIQTHPGTPSVASARRSAPVLTFLAAAIVALVFVEQFGGLIDVTRRPVLGADYQSAAAYVAARHLAGQPVLVALPPPGYLALGERDDLVFLASSLEAQRAQRYTRLTSDGHYVDFWLGVPAIVGTRELCSAMNASPDLWLIVDEARLSSDWAFAGSMADAIRVSTYEVYSGKGSASVRRPNTDDLGRSSLGSPCDITDASAEQVMGWTR
jgi:hypothetical protein